MRYLGVSTMPARLSKVRYAAQLGRFTNYYNLLCREVTAERGPPQAQVSLAWPLSHPTVTAPIVGATTLSHLDNAVAATSVTLSAEEIARLAAPCRPHEVVPKR